jgi:hypothetical protein
MDIVFQKKNCNRAKVVGFLRVLIKVKNGSYKDRLNRYFINLDFSVVFDILLWYRGTVLSADSCRRDREGSNKAFRHF